MSPRPSRPRPGERRTEELVEALVVSHLEGDDARTAELLDRLSDDPMLCEMALAISVGRLLTLLNLLTHPDPRCRLVVDEDDTGFGVFSKVVSAYYDPATGERLDRPVARPHNVG
jgi:hypothetical protein